MTVSIRSLLQPRHTTKIRRPATGPVRPTRRLLLEQLESRDCPSHVSPAVPAYSSLPGANHTIYLDFNGHVTENTSWNSYFNNPSIDSPPYDTSGDSSTFNSTELAAIEDAWKRMAEDFIPFNVNVTTVDPGIEALRKVGTTDTQWGVRVVITADTEASGAGGIAYIDSFNWSSDTPVWVYTTGGKNIAEAGSHEVGHSLGLSHDGLLSGASYYQGHGSGDTGWASIMGVGYYRNVTQWDRGEYYNSNNAGSSANYSKGPDDLAIITSYNGFGYRNDDHGNSSGSATTLSASGTSVSGSGIVGTTADVDVFTFTTGAGTVNLTVTPFTPGPNLDIQADLYDSAGALVASSNPATTLGASLSLSLSAGQYYLHLNGVGVGTPAVNPPSGYSDYASLGRYSVTGTIVDPGAVATLAINDVTVNESAGTATFTVTLTGTISSPVTVAYATANGSATVGSDYTNTAGTLTFNPGGPTTLTVEVPILDDASTESTETFVVNLSNSAGASITDGVGQGSIQDNDTQPQLNLSATSASKAEGTSAADTPFTFTVTRTGGSSGSSSANWAVSVVGTKNVAKPDDFEGNVFPSGTVNFASGETSKTITVLVNADSTKEGNEKFRVTLSNVTGATLGIAIADGTILNDDGGGKPGRGQSGLGEPAPIVDPIEWFQGHDQHADHSHEFAGDHDNHHHEFRHEAAGEEFGSLNALAHFDAVGTLTMEQPATMSLSDFGTFNTDLNDFGREIGEDLVSPNALANVETDSELGDQSDLGAFYLSRTDPLDSFASAEDRTEEESEPVTNEDASIAEPEEDADDLVDGQETEATGEETSLLDELFAEVGSWLESLVV